MTPLEIRNGITQVISNLTSRNPEEISDDTLLDESLGLDSLGQLEVLIEVDLTFQLDIPDDELPNPRTVRELVEYVEHYKKAERGEWSS